MKLPEDIKKALTKELIEELSQDDYDQAKDLIHFCLNCNWVDITAQEMFCSKKCIEEDLLKRWQKSDLYKQEQEEIKDLDQAYIQQIKLARKNNALKRQRK